MALDRTFTPLGPVPPMASGAHLRSGEDGRWRILPGRELFGDRTAAGWGEIGLLARGARVDDVVEGISSLSDGENAYEMFSRAGALVIGPLRESNAGILLSGGSYSRVHLDLKNDPPVVRKVLVSAGDHLDRERRHRLECEWLDSLEGGARALFPAIIEAHHDTERVILGTEFVAGYSLAELVFQGRIGAEELAAILRRVYREVAAELWSRDPLTLSLPVEPDGYLPRIRRRIATIDAAGPRGGDLLRSVLAADTVTVNGRRCAGVRSLLAQLENDPRWSAVVMPTGASLCHGDLILEDIIVPEADRDGFRLVDPNPNNRHPAYDVFKTMMSLWLGYEFMYFDLFKLRVLAHGSPNHPQLELALDRSEVQTVYSAAGDAMLRFVEAELVDTLGLPASDLRAQLCMGAALNMLAIPAFHVLHHRAEHRAVAFAASALWHAEEAQMGPTDSARQGGASCMTL